MIKEDDLVEIVRNVVGDLIKVKYDSELMTHKAQFPLIRQSL
jgi:hypothetical protein